MNLLKAEYERDFYSWIHQNIELLKQGKLAEIDVDTFTPALECLPSRSSGKYFIVVKQEICS